MRRSRIALISGIVIIIGAGCWLFRTGDLKERLGEDLQTVYAPRTRPTHLTPGLNASFGDVLLPVLPELRASADRYRALPSETQDRCSAVRQGRQPASAMPPECVAEVEGSSRAVAEALRATHAERADIPAGLNALHAEFWATDAPGWMGVQHAAKLAAFDVRLRLAGHAPTPELAPTAVQECVDGLALARDSSRAQGLIGCMAASAIVGLLAESCAAALDAAPVDEKRRAATQILSIRDGMKSFRDVLKDESVFSQLALAKVALSDRELEHLPTEAVALVRVHPSEVSWWLKPFAALTWRQCRSKHERWYRAMDHPRRDRVRALTEADPSDMGKFFKRHLRALERLELLAAAATADVFRVENGRWPSREELLVAAAGLEEAEFSMKAAEAELTLSLPDDGYGSVSIALAADSKIAPVSSGNSDRPRSGNSGRSKK